MPKIRMHAFNLTNPSHMEWTNDKKLLVSEHTTGCIYDVAKGGDMSKAKPVYKGLEGPASIRPLKDGRIAVSEAWAGRIRDVTSKKSSGADFARKLDKPYSLVEIDGNIYATVSDGPLLSKVVRTSIETGKDVATKDVVTGLPALAGFPGLTPPKAWPDWERFAAAGCVQNWDEVGRFGFFLAISALGAIANVTKFKGSFQDLARSERIVARGLGTLGAIKTHPREQLIFATEPLAGNVVAVDPKGSKNYAFEPPVLSGLNRPSCIRFSPKGDTMYVCSQADGVVWRVTDFL